MFHNELVIHTVNHYDTILLKKEQVRKLDNGFIEMSVLVLDYETESQRYEVVLVEVSYQDGQEKNSDPEYFHPSQMKEALEAFEFRVNSNSPSFYSYHQNFSLEEICKMEEETFNLEYVNNVDRVINEFKRMNK